MALTRKQTALIHVAKKRLGLGDDDYRAILRHEAGVETSKGLDADGFTAVMRRFQALGFKPSANPPTYGDRAGMATPAQVAYIRSLWKEYTDGIGDDRSLGKWLQREGVRPSLCQLRRGPEGDSRAARDGEQEEGRMSVAQCVEGKQ